MAVVLVAVAAGPAANPVGGCFVAFPVVAVVVDWGGGGGGGGKVVGQTRLFA